MIVVKFGGTSVMDAAAITRAREIVASRRERAPVVVVSALGGTTNLLLEVADQAAAGQSILALRSVDALRERHLQVAEALLGPGPALTKVSGAMNALIDNLAGLAGALAVLGDLTPRSRDAIAAVGEQLSSLLVAAAFREGGLPAIHVDARSVMITNSQFGRAEPDRDAIAEAARRIVPPIIRNHEIPVLGGFIGASHEGNTTTLGRGGSDFSASLIGAALQCETIEIWTDVDGMLSADPRVVPAAQLIECMGFDEASELASYGAKVLHPSTIAPAVRLGIPVYVLNSRNPESSGTRITADAPRRAVSAIAGRKNVTLVKVHSPRMLMTEGFLRVLFDIFERHHTSVDVVATSEVSVSLTVDNTDHLAPLIVELRALGDVAIDRGRGIVAVVGTGLSDDSSAMACALRALGSVRVHMLSLSATGINLTMIVDASQVDAAVRRLHAAFFENAAEQHA